MTKTNEDATAAYHSTGVPTVAQVRRYLERRGWRPGETYDYGTEWRQSYGGRFVVIPNWADDDTRLLEHSMVINVLADAAGHTIINQIPLTVANILVDDEDFQACSRDCWPRTSPESQWLHTLVWGRCAIAVEPEPQPATVDISRVDVAPDGAPSMSWTSVPLALFAPWTEHLPPSDQQDMLKEIADAEPDNRPQIVAEWKLTAEQVADSLRREVLLGTNEPSDFVEAARPGSDPA